MMGLFWAEEELRPRKTDDETRILRPVSTIDTNWVRPTTFPELEGLVAVDFETCDTGLKLGTGSSWPFEGEGYAIGIAVADAAHPAGLYYPTRHEGGGNMEDEAAVYDWLRVQLAKSSVTPVMANASYDMGWLRRHNITPANIPYDVLALAALVNENEGSYSLDVVLKRFKCGEKKEDLLYEVGRQMGLHNVKENLWRLPAPFVGGYAEADAEGTLRVLPVLLAELSAQGLDKIVDLERRVAMVAFQMRCRGVRVDLDRAQAKLTLFAQREADSVQEIKRLSGVTVDAWDARSIEAALVADGVHKVPRTATGGPSITRNLLTELADQGCVVAARVADMRRYNKAGKVFLESYILGHQRNGRLHCEFNSLRKEDDDGTGFGTVSGRFSSSSPNLQNIPARDKEIREAVRQCFLAEEGEEWGKGDYASQEPRLTLHYANIMDLTGAASMAERFAADPTTDLHAETAVRMGVSRAEAKTINLGIAYGMQGGKLCMQLGLPYTMKAWRGRMLPVAGPEGEALMERQRAAMPFIQELYHTAANRAKNMGEIRTLLGRKCRFMLFDNGYGYTHKACNRLIQGSAADQIKKGMVDLYEQHNVVPLVTVHDELGFSLRPGDAAQAALYRQVMEQAVPLSIPFVVDMSRGPSWGDLQAIPGA